MSNINVRPTQPGGIGGRATCSCGWTETADKRTAYEAALTHNTDTHQGTHEVHVDYTLEDK